MTLSRRGDGVSRALVLSGGGTSGVAWQTGLLKGFRDNGVDLTTADLLVGTSAGAIVSAQLATGHNLDELYAIQCRPPGPPESLRPRNVMALMQAMAEIKRRSNTSDRPGLDAAELVELGAAAVKAETETEASRLATVNAYLPSAKEWTDRRLLLTAIDLADGSLVVWDKNSRATLVEAVASSCAAALVAPPTTIGGRRYMDAGPRSGTSAQLAAGHELVVVVAIARPGPLGSPLSEEIDTLRMGGSRVEVIVPNAASIAVLFPNLLDGTRRPRCAEAGYAQGAASAAGLCERLAAH